VNSEVRYVGEKDGDHALRLFVAVISERSFEPGGSPMSCSRSRAPRLQVPGDPLRPRAVCECSEEEVCSRKGSINARRGLKLALRSFSGAHRRKSRLVDRQTSSTVALLQGRIAMQVVRTANLVPRITIPRLEFGNRRKNLNSSHSELQVEPANYNSTLEFEQGVILQFEPSSLSTTQKGVGGGGGGGGYEERER